MLRDETIRRVVNFRDARNWRQFHTPKDLAISMNLEAAELLESRGVRVFRNGR
jgi:NTP pyrophosphatase (non-canonical NTP hydrolase)